MEIPLITNFFVELQFNLSRQLNKTFLEFSVINIARKKILDTIITCLMVITAFSAFGTPYEVSCLKPTGQILILSNFNIQNLKIILEFVFMFSLFSKKLIFQT